MKNNNAERRHPGERRWALQDEFPVTDSSGVLVIAERRNLPDRRLDNTTLEDRLLMFSGMPQVESD
jgi:hypothetical protein